MLSTVLKLIRVLSILAAFVSVQVGCCDRCADIESVAVSGDRKLIASLCGRDTACVWDTNSGSLLHKIETDKYLFSSVAFSPKADLLATGFDNGTITVWDWKAGTRIVDLKNDKGSAWVFSAVFSPDGQTIVGAGMGWPIRVWNIRDGTVMRDLAGSGMPDSNCYWRESPTSAVGIPDASDNTCLAYSLAYSPDGKTIAAGSKRWLRLWDAGSGALIRTFDDAREIGGLGFAPDGKLLGSVSEDGTATIWNISTGAKVHQLSVSRRPLRSVAFSPDGTAVAVSGWDGRIYVWNWSSETFAHRISASTGAVNWVFFSADASEVISGGLDDNLISIWKRPNGELIRRMSCRSAVLTGFHLF